MLQRLAHHAALRALMMQLAQPAEITAVSGTRVFDALVRVLNGPARKLKIDAQDVIMRECKDGGATRTLCEGGRLVQRDMKLEVCALCLIEL